MSWPLAPSQLFLGDPLPLSLLTELLTILCTDTQEVDDILVLVHKFHHFHF